MSSAQFETFRAHLQWAVFACDYASASEDRKSPSSVKHGLFQDLLDSAGLRRRKQGWAEPLLQQARESGVDGYTSKPLLVTHLLSEVHRVITFRGAA